MLGVLPPEPKSTLDFSSQGLGQNFLSLSSVIGQVFFVGDGQTDSAQAQTFMVPSGATWLYLGFPDAPNSQGPPGAYDDNQGPLQVNVIVVPEPSVALLASLGLALLGGRLRSWFTA